MIVPSDVITGLDLICVVVGVHSRVKAQELGVTAGLIPQSEGFPYVPT
jgi:hypothetical protein